jgi:predicted amidohydrolase YtcJ
MPLASMISRGDTILTMVDDRPMAEAVVIVDGRILAIANEFEVMALASESTKVIDLKGHTLMPFFIDAHGHFANAPQIVTWVNVPDNPVLLIHSS